MKYVVIGNSGSGKSTLARVLGERLRVSAIDLDTVYWEPERPGVARAPDVALADLAARLKGARRWVVEGCYEVLAEGLADRDPVLLWLDPGPDVCVAHCRARPWEPHKYPSKEAQDANLEMLLDWVRAHYEQDGEMSHRSHLAFFERYHGPKCHLTSVNYRVDELVALAQS